MAISPQTPDKSQATLLKNYLQYEVLSDLGNVVARQFGLVYQVPEWIRSLYRSYGADLPAYNADQSWELPVVGTFVIGAERQILLAHADIEVGNLLEPKAIVDALQSVAAASPR